MQNIQVDGKNFEMLLEEEAINKRTRLLGIQINVDYEEKCPVFIGVLNGSFFFMGDLMKEINISCEIAFIKVASYSGTENNKGIKEVFGLPENLAGRDIIVVEDIVDTGHTLEYILNQLSKVGAKSIEVCTLLHKPKAAQTNIPAMAYVGFEIPNDFVVGYGLDYNQLGRNLRSIFRAID